LQVIAEELNEKMESLRIKYLSEFSAIIGDDTGSPGGRLASSSGGGASLSNDTRRLNRLQLLISSILTNISTEVNRSTIVSKDMLAKAAQISPGDREAMENFMRTLPIESNLMASNSFLSGSKASRPASPSTSPHKQASGADEIGIKASYGSSKRLSADDLNTTNPGLENAFDRSLADGWI
jgi:hypothetical protein